MTILLKLIIKLFLCRFIKICANKFTAELKVNVYKCKYWFYFYWCENISGRIFFKHGLQRNIMNFHWNIFFCCQQNAKAPTPVNSLICTVEPLTNDHPHQRPSLSYDHISCYGQWFLFVYESLTSDHPSYTTTPMWFWGWSYKRGSTVLQ